MKATEAFPEPVEHRGWSNSVPIASKQARSSGLGITRLPPKLRRRMRTLALENPGIPSGRDGFIQEVQNDAEPVKHAS